MTLEELKRLEEIFEKGKSFEKGMRYFEKAAVEIRENPGYFADSFGKMLADVIYPDDWEPEEKKETADFFKKTFLNNDNLRTDIIDFLVERLKVESFHFENEFTTLNDDYKFPF